MKEQAKYAVKVVENKSLADEENLEALETEIDILRKLDHPHIVALKEVVVCTSDTYIVMELLSGGELFNRIVEQGRFSEHDAAELFAQILLSMEYLHSLNIVHRDVKPENILYVSQGSTQIKLIDFGYAGLWAPDKELSGLCGTPDYVAPEVLSWYDEDDNGTPYGKGSDLWSLGVLLYVILSGCSPFSAEEEEAILQLVAQAKYEFHESEWATVSESAKDLIKKLLVVAPAQRMTMPEMLEHPWLKEAVANGRGAIDEKLKLKEVAKAAAETPVPPSSTKPVADPSPTKGPAIDHPEIQPRVEGVGKKGLAGCCTIS
mmetsp:Transcript_24703/g.49526  ORF Transcript_24703/g.49526 Transcript_24703/m.49526 type:complete len:318 (+) Transcript_24703:396-1349(+)